MTAHSGDGRLLDAMPAWPEPLDQQHMHDLWQDDLEGYNDALFNYERAMKEAYAARLRWLVNHIKYHDQCCDEACGIGELEGLGCGYRPYFPRRCPTCPKHDKHDDWLETIGPLPEASPEGAR